MKKKKALVVGGYKAEVPEAIKRKCFQCNADVYIMPWNDDKEKCCMFCVFRLIETDNCIVVVSEKDSKRAKEEQIRRSKL